MKVIFVCKSNFGRSQVAESFFNSIYFKDEAISAGVEKGRVTGHKLKDFPEHSNLFICMDEIGIDIKENIVKLLTPEMIENVNKVFVMVEKELCPDFLLKSKKVVFWQVEDMADQSLEKYREIRDKIITFVKNLVKEIN